MQEPSIHAIDGATGAVKWQGEGSHSFGPTVVAGGMTFVGTAIARSIQIRDASNGVLLHTIPLPNASDSGSTTRFACRWRGASPHVGPVSDPDRALARTAAGSIEGS